MVVIALFAWNYFSIKPLVSNLVVISIPTVCLAGLTLFFAIVSLFWNQKKYIFYLSLAIYLLLSATAATIVVSTGNESSVFVSLWMIVCFFAGIFSIWGLLPIVLATGAFIAVQYIDKNLTPIILVATTLSSLIPLVAGFIIWHGKSAKDESDNDNKAFRNLANELNVVSSKAEVVINAIGDGVIAIDNQGIIQLINPAAQNIIGWGKQDAIALSYRSILKLINQKDESLDPSSDPIQQALNANQEIRTNNLSLMTNSGKKLMISLVASPVGEIGSGVITVFHDITKEKADEREQAEFISTASHEMRTPVASIEGYLGLALNPQTAQIDNRARDFILKAHASAEHLGYLFQDLLDVAKSDDGRIVNKPRVINLVIFVRDVVQGLKQKANDKGLQLTYKPMPDNSTERHIAPSYSVNLDNDHIREIVDNLVENAIKYTPSGEILVDVTGDEERVVISVKDSGVGIPAEDMQHLFQKFYRVDDKNTRDIGGTGLGLYLCRRLTEIMGGRIWAESTYSKGSTFFVELPRVSNQDATRLLEQQTRNDQLNEKKNVSTSQTTMSTISATNAAPQLKPVINMPTPREPIHSVPRGQALTSEQIAAYVSKQRALAQQQAAPQLARPQSIKVPSRVIGQ
ncbi:MAG TPA: ATP-binding protein [Candidatus Saccharimonadales bacterium]|nr:ATP-binding protein [Candidatus Saccharimonadales bacterium]